MMWRLFKFLMTCVSRFRWIVLAFIASGLFVSGLLIWQLTETTPAKWCGISALPRAPQGCFDVLLRLVDVKDHAIIGLLVILGLTVLSVVAVTLKVKIDVDGPGDVGGSIGGVEQ